MTNTDKSRTNHFPSYELDRRRFDTIFPNIPDVVVPNTNGEEIEEREGDKSE